MDPDGRFLGCLRDPTQDLWVLLTAGLVGWYEQAIIRLGPFGFSSAASKCDRYMTVPTHPFQSRDVLIPLADPWDAQTHIIVLEEYGSLRFYRTRGEEFQILLSPPAGAEVYVRPRWRSPEYEKVDRVENIIAVAIGKARGKLKLADAMSRITSMPLEVQEAEGILRCLVARGDFIATIEGKRKPQVWLSLSTIARTRENRRSYAASFAHELALQSEQIGRLIGHAPTLGGEREELLRALLERHVPARFHVATGFIEGSDRQIDILIYDQVDFAPAFRIGNLVVVPIEAVRALIEVKSMLTADQLGDALHHLDEAGGIRTSGPPIFRGVFGYKGATVATLLDAVVHHHREATDEDWGGAQVGSIYEMVDAVCVLGSSILVSGFWKSNWRDEDGWTPGFAEQGSESGRNLQAALFLARLMMFLRHPFEGRHSQPSRSAPLMKDVENRKITYLYPDRDWGAYFIDQGVDHLEKQIEAYNKWLAGYAWVEPPLL